MKCDEAMAWIDAYADGELDPVSALPLEAHLADCARCTQRYENVKAMKKTLHSPALRYAVPADVEQRLRATLRNETKEGEAREAKQEGKASRTGPFVLQGPTFPRRAVLAVALWGLVILGVVCLRFWPTSVARDASPREALAQEVLASHIRSLMAAHLSDVVSTDKHTVKPWFSGKLDYAPVVNDLRAEGFPLLGGRLDYLQNRPVAALVYGRQKHRINLFLWPTSEKTEGKIETFAERGYHLIHWNQAGMDYWAVSDVNAADLQRFAALVQTQ